MRQQLEVEILQLAAVDRIERKAPVIAVSRAARSLVNEVVESGHFA
ncbi:hypothetical protein [Burkholderia ubonensis]|nr:hypothetical protein [Burkholderia ubonensis]